MHFRSDKQFLKLTKILEIKNKRNFNIGLCDLKHTRAGGGDLTFGVTKRESPTSEY
jgi:hypothetical protein